MRYILITIQLIVVISSFHTGISQNNDRYIFWSDSVVITPSDFKKNVSEELKQASSKYGIDMNTAIGIKAKLDIPKKKRDRKRKVEKHYIAAIFDKTNSEFYKYDTLELKYNLLYLDIAELHARKLRKSFEDLKNESFDKIHKKTGDISNNLQIIGLLKANFPALVKRAQQNYLKEYDKYTKEVVIEKNPNAYEDWKKEISRRLDALKQYTMTEEEKLRIEKEKPILDNYINYY